MKECKEVGFHLSPTILTVMSVLSHKKTNASWLCVKLAKPFLFRSLSYIKRRTYVPSPEDLLFDLSINVLLLGFERFDFLAKVMSAFTRDIVILQI